MKRTRRPVLALVIVSIVATILVIFARSPEAQACSIAPPMLEVAPQRPLEPGQSIKAWGYGFYDAIYHDVEPALQTHPPDSCAGIELVPSEVVIVWNGAHAREKLAVVKGPDFEVELVVPDWAEPGIATISANGFEVPVSVADAPDPCPRSTQEAQALAYWPPHCPDPCTYPATDAGTARWCDPCPMHATDAHDLSYWPPHCPDPCGFGVDVAAIWCPCPSPAIEAGHGTGVAPDIAWPPHCPDPCTDVTTAAYWCPCPLPAAGATDLSYWPPHCPDPCVDVAAGVWWCCPTTLHGSGLEDSAPVYPCEPCPPHILGFPGDRPPVVGGCPAPCPLMTGEAVITGCPDPCTVQPHGTAICIDPYPVPVPVPEPCEIDPGGTSTCGGPVPVPLPVEPATESVETDETAETAETDETVDTDETVETDDTTTSVEARPVAAPAPRIDFDGCVGGAVGCGDMPVNVVARVRDILVRLLAWMPFA
ncbi:MAG: hypothetical protein AAF567_20895 [Actinomycetota bacterium]